MGFGLSIGTSRLFAVCEFLLRAHETDEELFNAITAHIEEPGAGIPPPTREFTHLELAEGLAFLLRMGYFEVEDLVDGDEDDDE